MMKYVLLAGVTLLNIFGLLAQSDFRKGYVILNENDTVFGLLDYKGNKNNSKKCIYKQNFNSERQIFTPYDIIGYRFIDSKYYVSKPVNIEGEVRRLFLEYLINATVDVYYFRDLDGDHYYVEDDLGNFIELKNSEKEVVINDKKYVKESNEFVGVLKVVFKESPTVSKKAQSTSLNHKSLIDITTDYHNEICPNEECIVYEKKLDRIPNKFGVVLGVNGMSISESANMQEEYYYLENSNFGFNIFPSVGVFYKINMSFVDERLFLHYEATYSRTKLTTSNTYIEPVYRTEYINDISWVESRVQNLCVFNYEFPRGKFRPTFQFGGFLNYFFGDEYSRNLEASYSWGEVFDTDQTNDNPFSKWGYGINLGLGLRSTYKNDKELYLDMRYQAEFGRLKGIMANVISINLGFQI
ncbi:hypothetical protein [Flavisericum labens]|uniref:hypothetical protein n=1 Tax=Flavisericum labens TaxID=3377112 RepID=UPI00387B37D8